MFTPSQRVHGAIRNLVLRNGATIFGASLTTVSAVSIVFIVLLGVFDFVHSGYLGIMSFIVLPGLMLIGLASIALGHYMAWLQSGGEKASEETDALLVIDLRKATTRRTAALVVFLTLTNIFLVSAVGYKGIEYTESVEFCGTLCHTVMEPEYTAYLDSPHSNVSCADCHIGPGAPWFVKSKISGLSQVIGVLTNNYHRPVPTPITNLRPAQDTCELCHWPKKFIGDRLLVRSKFSEDETNSELKTLLLMHIGGGNSGGKGIHDWHVSSDRTTYYLPATEDKQSISLVRVWHDDGTVENFVPDGFTEDPKSIPDSALKRMDCIDCHNRPTHVFHGPDEAMNLALRSGEIDRTLPYIRKVGMEALVAAEKEADPDGYIRQYLQKYYETEQAEVLATRKETVDAAISSVIGLFHRNVFPKMNVGWNAYPNNISHINSPGCFRCHDEGHKSAEGKTIAQDCTACHQVLAWDEPDPQLATDLGVQ